MNKASEKYGTPLSTLSHMNVTKKNRRNTEERDKYLRK